MVKSSLSHELKYSYLLLSAFTHVSEIQFSKPLEFMSETRFRSTHLPNVHFKSIFIIPLLRTKITRIILRPSICLIQFILRGERCIHDS